MSWTVRHFSGEQCRHCFCDVTQQWKPQGWALTTGRWCRAGNHRNPPAAKCSLCLKVSTEINQEDTAVSRGHGGACPDSTAFLVKPKSSLHQIIVTKKWKCATGCWCFAVFSPVHCWHFNHLTGWLGIINLPKWTALFILLFQPIAYYFIWLKIWIFTALRVFLIFLQSESTYASQASPYYILGSLFPNIALSNAQVAKIRKLGVLWYSEELSLIITFPHFPLFFWGKLYKRTQAWSTKRRS